MVLSAVGKKWRCSLLAGGYWQQRVLAGTPPFAMVAWYFLVYLPLSRSFNPCVTTVLSTIKPHTRLNRFYSPEDGYELIYPEKWVGDSVSGPSVCDRFFFQEIAVVYFVKSSSCDLV